jgi:hypothetical protein
MRAGDVLLLLSTDSVLAGCGARLSIFSTGCNPSPDVCLAIGDFPSTEGNLSIEGNLSTDGNLDIRGALSPKPGSVGSGGGAVITAANGWGV